MRSHGPELYTTEKWRHSTKGGAESTRTEFSALWRRVGETIEGDEDRHVDADGDAFFVSQSSGGGLAQ